jgi:hypothetical protein
MTLTFPYMFSSPGRQLLSPGHAFAAGERWHIITYIGISDSIRHVGQKQERFVPWHHDRCKPHSAVAGGRTAAAAARLRVRQVHSWTSGPGKPKTRPGET